MPPLLHKFNMLTRGMVNANISATLDIEGQLMKKVMSTLTCGSKGLTTDPDREANVFSAKPCHYGCNKCRSMKVAYIKRVMILL
jgi:hypothetical protein